MIIYTKYKLILIKNIQKTKLTLVIYVSSNSSTLTYQYTNRWLLIQLVHMVVVVLTLYTVM